MSLRVKILLMAGLCVISVAIAANLIQQFIIENNYTQLEEKEMRAHLARVHHVLALELAQLKSMTADWAYWDDTYTFIEDGNTAYIQSNLADSTLENLRLNLMVFVHASGKIVASKAFDLQHQREMPLPPSLSTHINRLSVSPERTDLSGIVGIVMLDEGPLLITALPILTSQEEGPARGTLILGRLLDEGELTHWSEITQLSLLARRWDDARLPADFQTARATLTTSPSYVQPLDDQVMAGYTLLNDVYAQPALILRTTMPRTITQQGRLSQLYLTVLVLASGTIAYALGMWGLDRLMLTRVEHLARQVRDIGERGRAAQRVTVTGNDELGTLEREINRMLETLSQSEERYRDLVEHSHALICTHDLQGNFLSVNEWALRSIGYEKFPDRPVNLRDILAPEVRDQADEYLARIQRDGYAEGLMLVQTRSGEKRLWEYHNTLRTEGVAQPIVRGIAYDITEQKKLERALRYSERRWRAYIEQASDLIFALDASARITLANRALCDMLGYAPEELSGKSLLEFVAPESRAAAQDALERIFCGETIDPFETVVLTRTQQRAVLEVRGHAFREGNTITETLHIARDITARKNLEELLRQQAQVYRALIENISDVITLTDEHHWIRFISPSVSHVLGYTPGDLIGTDLFEMTHPDERATLQAAFERALHDPWHTHRIGHRLRHRDGTWRDCETIAQSYAREHGIDIVLSTRDITTRKQREDELRRSRKEWHDIFNAIGHPTFILDLQHGVIAANPAALKQLGKTESEVLGKRCYELFHDTTCPPVNCPMEALLRTGTTQSVEMQTTQGTFLVSCTPVLNEQGAIEKVIHIATDVTELKRVQAELQAANARFYALVEGIPDIVYLKDTQGRNLYVNRAYEDFAKATRANIVGKSDDEIMPPDLAAQCMASDARVFENGTPVRIEESTTDREGKHVWYETIKNPIRDANGKIIGLVGVSRDITERKRAEALIREYSEHLEQLVEARTRELHQAQEQLVHQERLATLGQLAGSIAHELRSPLSAIKNAAYYLKIRLENLEEDTREMIHILDKQVDASAHIIESLLDFARPKTPVLKRVHLPYVIQAALEQSRVPDSVTLDWQVAPDLPDVFVDAAQMQIVFRNLITNAIQAMPNGGALTISVYTEGETICATFTDTGHGIPLEALDKIFQPLYTTKAKGIGLGLALCKLIVEAHDGKISVTSQVGKGTTFTVALPINLVEDKK